jgi:ribosomal protein S18 acetylase RimI-like enzyme
MPDSDDPPGSEAPRPSRTSGGEELIRVRRIHRRDLNKVWEFLKLVFRDVNRETVEYQRPRSKGRFSEVYEEEGVEQLIFELDKDGETEIVGYAECAFEITGADNWMNERYFAKRDMRPLYVEEIAVHPAYHGRGIGNFLLEQCEHLARVRGCTHLVLEVAENNTNALKFYRTRSFYKLDAAIFLAKKVVNKSELLEPRKLRKPRAARIDEPAVKAIKSKTKSPKQRAAPPPARAPEPAAPPVAGAAEPATLPGDKGGSGHG